MKTNTLKSFQKQFCLHIRNPKKNAKPSGIKSDRMQVYNDLLFNNVEDCVANCFPVLKTLLQEKKWNQLLRIFFETHSAKTPFYRRIPEEFVTFLNQNPKTPQWQKDLAYYEWIELDLYLDPREITYRKSKSNLKLEDELILNPLCHLFYSSYPLHQIEKQKKYLAGTPQFNFYAAYRTSEDEVYISSQTPLEIQMLEFLKKGPLKINLLLEKVFKKLGIFDAKALENQRQLLNTLKNLLEAQIIFKLPKNKSK